MGVTIYSCPIMSNRTPNNNGYPRDFHINWFSPNSSEGFSPGSPVFLPPQKSTFLNSPIRSGNRRGITWFVQSIDCPMCYPLLNGQLIYLMPILFIYVNYARFNGFLSNVFYRFQNLGKALRTLSLKRSS